MKIPTQKMYANDLIQWVYEFDFDYWAQLYLENDHANPGRIKELFEQEVYDLIWDEVMCGGEYDSYILHEEDNGGEE